MASAREFRAALAQASAIVAGIVALLVGLQVLLVDAPRLRDGGFADGLVHGALWPVNAARWLMGSVGVKDFASGWSYEAGFTLAAIALVCAWQTALQVRANAVIGRTHPIEGPVLRAAVGFWLATAVVGLLLGGGLTPPTEPVPPLWAVIPGWLRHGGMAVAGLLIGATGALAAVGFAVGRAGSARSR